MPLDTTTIAAPPPPRLTEILSADEKSTASIELAPNFDTLPPDQKQAIISHARSNSALFAPNTSTADAPPDTSYGSAVMSGLAATAHGFGRTANALGFPETGASIADSVGAPKNYDPAGPKVTQGFRGGNFGAVVSNLPRAAVEAAAPTVGALAAGAAGSVGGPVGAAAGAGSFIAGSTFGDNVDTVAKNNNRPDAPTLSDKLQAGAVTAGEAALGTVGLKPGLLPGAVGAAVRRSGLFGKAAAEVGADAVAGGANSALGQAGTSIGTDKGLTVDPAEVATGAATAGVTRLGTKAPEVIGAGVGKAATTVGDALTAAPTPEAAQSNVRVTQAVQERITQVKTTSGRDIPFDEAANSVRSELTANLRAAGRQLRDQAAFDVTPDDYARIIEPLVTQAATHNREVAGATDAQTQTALSRFQELNIPDHIKQTFVEGITDLSTIAQASRKNRQTGPLETYGGLAGQTAGIVGSIASGNPLAMVGAVAGHGVAAGVGRTLGRVGDNLFGLASPKVVLAGARSQRILDAQKLSAGANSLTATSGMLDELIPTALDIDLCPTAGTD